MEFYRILQLSYFAQLFCLLLIGARPIVHLLAALARASRVPAPTSFQNYLENPVIHSIQLYLVYYNSISKTQQALEKGEASIIGIGRARVGVVECKRDGGTGTRGWTSTVGMLNKATWSRRCTKERVEVVSSSLPNR